MSRQPIDNDHVQMCDNCGVTETPLWRKQKDGSMACNKCALYKQLHGKQRPKELFNGNSYELEPWQVDAFENYSIPRSPIQMQPNQTALPATESAATERPSSPIKLQNILLSLLPGGSSPTPPTHKPLPPPIDIPRNKASQEKKETIEYLAHQAGVAAYGKAYHRKIAEYHMNLASVFDNVSQYLDSLNLNNIGTEPGISFLESTNTVQPDAPTTNAAPETYSNPTTQANQDQKAALPSVPQIKSSLENRKALIAAFLEEEDNKLKKQIIGGEKAERKEKDCYEKEEKERNERERVKEMSEIEKQKNEKLQWLEDKRKRLKEMRRVRECMKKINDKKNFFTKSMENRERLPVFLSIQQREQYKEKMKAESSFENLFDYDFDLGPWKEREAEPRRADVYEQGDYLWDAVMKSISQYPEEKREEILDEILNKNIENYAATIETMKREGRI